MVSVIYICPLLARYHWFTAPERATLIEPAGGREAHAQLSPQLLVLRLAGERNKELPLPQASAAVDDEECGSSQENSPRMG